MSLLLLFRPNEIAESIIIVTGMFDEPANTASTYDEPTPTASNYDDPSPSGSFYDEPSPS